MLGLPNIGQQTSPKIWEVSYAEPTNKENDFEFIPTEKLETRHPIEGSFGSQSPLIYNQSGVMDALNRKTLKFLLQVLRFRKNDPLQ